MSDYTPPEARIRIDYCNAAIKRSQPDGTFWSMEDADAAFGRWLAAHDAEVLAAAGATQPEPEYEYTSADYDGTPNNQSFYVYGSVPARIAKYRRVKAGAWEPVPSQTGEADGRS